MDVNVRDHGAKGDGLTDDTAAIQSAIDTAVGARFESDTAPVVALPDGVYSVTGTLSRRDVLLRGSGSLVGSVIKWDGPPGGTVVVNGVDGFGNSFGGFVGVHFKAGANEPATFLDFTPALVDAQHVLQDVSFNGCTSDAITVGDWTNLHWSRLRWDNVGGFAIRATPTAGQAMNQSSFHLTDFTYDHSRIVAPGSGFLCVDNSVRNGTDLGPVVLEHARVEVNTAWVGSKALATIVQPANPAADGAVPLTLRHISYANGARAAGLSVIHRATTDTTRCEVFEIHDLHQSGIAAITSGTWAATNPAPPITGRVNVTARHGTVMVGVGSTSPLDVRVYSAGNDYAARFRNSFRGGGVQVGRGDAGAAPLEVLNPAGRIVGGWYGGDGTPEGVVAAPVGSLYTRTDGGPGSTLYVKESGNGRTGWAAK